MIVGGWAKCCSMGMEVKLPCILVNMSQSCVFTRYPN